MNNENKSDLNLKITPVKITMKKILGYKGIAIFRNIMRLKLDILR